MAELFGYHRKAAIRALRPKTANAAPFVRDRPKDYDPDKLLLPLKVIWLAALQPCGERLKACQPDWLPAYDAESRPDRKNDQAHGEPKNFTNVRLWFGCERCDHPDLWRLITTLCRGALHQLLNYCLPTDLTQKECCRRRGVGWLGRSL